MKKVSNPDKFGPKFVIDSFVLFKSIPIFALKSKIGKY